MEAPAATPLVVVIAEELEGADPAEPAAGPLLLGLPNPWPPATGCQAGVASPEAQSLIGGEVVLSRSVL